jgi:hypothetical protein
MDSFFIAQGGAYWSFVPEKRRSGRRKKMSKCMESELEYLGKQDGNI